MPGLLDLATLEDLPNEVNMRRSPSSGFLVKHVTILTLNLPPNTDFSFHPLGFRNQPTVGLGDCIATLPLPDPPNPALPPPPRGRSAGL